MEILDALRILRRRWLPALLTALVVAGLFALFPTRMMPLPPSTAVTEVTLRLQLGGVDADTVAKHQAQLNDAATADSTLVEARNLANVTPDYMKTGAKMTWRGPLTYDVTFTGPERQPTLDLARDYAELVGRLDAKILPGATLSTVSTRDVIANQRVLPADQQLGRKALSIPLGIVAGVIAGIAAAAVANALDKRVRGVQDLPLRGISDRQVLGAGTADRVAQIVAGRGLEAVELRGPAGAEAPGGVGEALRARGVELRAGAPVLLAVPEGSLKTDVGDGLAAAPDLAGIAVVR